MMKKLIFILSFLSVFATAEAAPLYNIPQTLVQPNGDTLHCFASGDEYFNYLHDANGYTIMQNPETGYYVYALPDGETIKASNYVAGKANPVHMTLQRNILPTAKKINELVAKKQKAMGVEAYSGRLQSGVLKASKINTLNNLVIFIRFSDDTETPFSSFSAFENYFMGETNSLSAYYKEVSYGQLTVATHFAQTPNGEIVLSYKDTHPRSYYLPYNAAANPNGYQTDTESTSRERTLLKNAIDYVKNQVPAGTPLDADEDGLVDFVSFVVSGSSSAWNDLLWPHRWSLPASYNATINDKRVSQYIFVLNTGFRVGLLCHETFHVLGGPDLYHASNGSFAKLQAVGQWDIMEISSLATPQHMSAYLKYKYAGWIDLPAIAPGVHTLYPLNSSRDKNCYKIPIPGTSQFYVLEYRKKAASGFESDIPASGLLVYRIDSTFRGNLNYDGETTWNEVYVFRPNGSMTENGFLADANFSAEARRTTFNRYTNPSPFRSNGTADYTIALTNISAAGDSITFQYIGSLVESITITTGETIELNALQLLSADIAPAGADIKKLKWSVIANSGNAIIEIKDAKDYLRGMSVGTVTLKAEAQDGSGKAATKEITVANPLVSTIHITVPGSIPLSAKQVPLTATVLPDNVPDKSLAWSVANESGEASISGENLLPVKPGTILLHAAAQDGSGVTAQKQITILPNPAAGHSVTAQWSNGNGSDGLLNLQSAEGIGRVLVYSVSGAKIADQQGSADSMQISFASWPHGSYVLKVWNKDRTKTSSVKIIW